MTFPLSVKARVGSLICTWWRRGMCCMLLDMHLWCDTCQPLDGQHGSLADLFHILVNKHWWGSKLGHIMVAGHCETRQMLYQLSYVCAA